MAICLAKKYPGIITGGHVFNAGSAPEWSVSPAWKQLTSLLGKASNLKDGKFHHHHISGDVISTSFCVPGVQNHVYDFGVLSAVTSGFLNPLSMMVPGVGAITGALSFAAIATSHSISNFL